MAASMCILPSAEMAGSVAGLFSAAAGAAAGFSAAGCAAAAGSVAGCAAGCCAAAANDRQNTIATLRTMSKSSRRKQIHNAPSVVNRPW